MVSRQRQRFYGRYWRRNSPGQKITIVAMNLNIELLKEKITSASAG